MTTFEQISSFKLEDIHENDLRKMQTEIKCAIEKIEKERYNKLFQDVIKAIDNLITNNDKDNCLCIESSYGVTFDWYELKDELTEYHDLHYL